jgi:hypothetical protein
MQTILETQRIFFDKVQYKNGKALPFSEQTQLSLPSLLPMQRRTRVYEE